MKMHLTKLSEKDLQESPVWIGVDSDQDETAIRPAKAAPRSVEGKIVASTFTLKNGSVVPGVMFNLSDDASLNQHLASAAFLLAGKWFFLARYHDSDVKRSGPVALAARLGLPLDQVFPIQYELTHLFKPPTVAQRGEILAEPRKRLTRAQIIALAVP